MSTYSIAQAKDQFSRLIDEVLEGGEVTITRHGKPVVEMRPAVPTGKRTRKDTMDMLRQFRESLPPYEGDTVADIRAMREDF